MKPLKLNINPQTNQKNYKWSSIKKHVERKHKSYSNKGIKLNLSKQTNMNLSSDTVDDYKKYWRAVLRIYVYCHDLKRKKQHHLDDCYFSVKDYLRRKNVIMERSEVTKFGTKKDKQLIRKWAEKNHVPMSKAHLADNYGAYLFVHNYNLKHHFLKMDKAITNGDEAGAFHIHWKQLYMGYTKKVMHDPKTGKPMKFGKLTLHKPSLAFSNAVKHEYHAVNSRNGMKAWRKDIDHEFLHDMTVAYHRVISPNISFDFTRNPRPKDTMGLSNRGYERRKEIIRATNRAKRQLSHSKLQLKEKVQAKRPIKQQRQDKPPAKQNRQPKKPEQVAEQLKSVHNGAKYKSATSYQRRLQTAKQDQQEAKERINGIKQMKFRQRQHASAVASQSASMASASASASASAENARDDDAVTNEFIRNHSVDNVMRKIRPNARRAMATEIPLLPQMADIKHPQSARLALDDYRVDDDLFHVKPDDRKTKGSWFQSVLNAWRSLRNRIHDKWKHFKVATKSWLHRAKWWIHGEKPSHSRTTANPASSSVADAIKSTFNKGHANFVKYGRSVHAEQQGLSSSAKSASSAHSASHQDMHSSSDNIMTRIAKNRAKMARSGFERT